MWVWWVYCTVDDVGDKLCDSDAMSFCHLDQLWEVVAREGDKCHAHTQGGEEDGGDAVDVGEGEETKSHVVTAGTQDTGKRHHPSLLRPP